MDDGVAVWADRAKISHRVKFVVCADAGERDDMMDMDEASECFPVRFEETEPADNTRGTIVGNAGVAGTAVTFVSVHKDPIDTPFMERLVTPDLLWKRRSVVMPAGWLSKKPRFGNDQRITCLWQRVGGINNVVE